MADDVEAMVKREIEAARRILQSDGVSVSLRKIHERLDKIDPPDPVADPSKPPAPPLEDPKPPPEPRKSVWWGEQA